MKYEKPKGRRIKNYGFLWIEADCINYWYFEKLHNWHNDNEAKTNGLDCSSGENCKSLKAAMRKINRAEVPKGTIFRLVSRYEGYDIYLAKK